MEVEYHIAIVCVEHTYVFQLVQFLAMHSGKVAVKHCDT